jgi:hypothetical protein
MERDTRWRPVDGWFDGEVLASIYTLRTTRLAGVVWSNEETEGEPDPGRERGGSDTGR